MDKTKLRCSGVGKSAIPRWVCRDAARWRRWGSRDANLDRWGLVSMQVKTRSKAAKTASRSEFRFFFLWDLAPGNSAHYQNLRGLAGKVVCASRKEGQRSGMGMERVKAGGVSQRRRYIYVLG